MMNWSPSRSWRWRAGLPLNPVRRLLFWLHVKLGEMLCDADEDCPCAKAAAQYTRERLGGWFA